MDNCSVPNKGANDASLFMNSSVHTHVSSSTNNIVSSVSHDNVACSVSNVGLCHYRLGHIPFAQMKYIDDVAHDSPFSDICQICPKARMHKHSFSISSIKTSKPFELIHVDIWDPYKHSTYNDYKYFLTIVDDYTRATWVHLFASKSSAFTLLKPFVALK